MWFARPLAGDVVERQMPNRCETVQIPDRGSCLNTGSATAGSLDETSPLNDVRAQRTKRTKEEIKLSTTECTPYSCSAPDCLDRTISKGFNGDESTGTQRVNYARAKRLSLSSNAEPL